MIITYLLSYAKTPVLLRSHQCLKGNHINTIQCLRRSISTSIPVNNVSLLSVNQLNQRHIPEYVNNPHSFFKSLLWRKPPSNILVVKKPWQKHVRKAMVKFIKHLNNDYPSCNVLVTQECADEIMNDFDSSRDALDLESDLEKIKYVIYTGTNEEIVSKTDLIVSLGGDGTILRAVSMFSNTSVPPVLSFSLGTLGFLLPFDFADHKRAFKEVFESRATMLNRERLECHIVKKSTNIPSNGGVNEESIYKTIASENTKIHAMNDIVLHRGSLPSLISLDIHINGNFLTSTTADGLIFATPTGSTAYSLSAGGSIVHPIVPCVMLTPVCPRSLSFRPLILPSTSHIVVKVRGKPGLSNSAHICTAKLSVDGIPQLKLMPGDEIHVVSESGAILDPSWDVPETIKTTATTTINNNITNTGIWCVARTKGDWVTGINNLLGFNSGFRSINADGVKSKVETEE
ncbi:hypothetical protein CANARDRAFT_30068 [[Candida] arabinofermentans NRRL YB-2248]|uniref:Uncharacterized protein n=1 Tax=[Candida] arabinofermentans NRRL YB-2248 TaxID=983967 RepID=A0A1E4SUW2_9ASCO|nr:hypothetical protein CANARDRAFT_30068 [[Candida] arabinofermentans NRRL YB-2248]